LNRIIVNQIIASALQSPSELTMEIFEVIIWTDAPTALNLEHNREDMLAAYPVIEDNHFSKAKESLRGVRRT
jgi:hypothetical protein